MTAELRIRVTGDTAQAQNALKAISVNVGFQAVALGVREIGSSLNIMAQAAREDEVSVFQLRQAVENTGASFGTYSKQLDDTIKKGMALGFTDDQTRRSLALLTAQTGDAAEAQKRFALAQDLSRGANIDLEVASRLLGKVTEENVSVLQRYGISIEKGATQTELFAKLQERFGGQAQKWGETNEAAAQRAAIAYGELQEELGSKLLPAQTAVLEGFTSLPEPIQLGGVALAKFGPALGQTAVGLVAMGTGLSNIVKLLPAMGAAALAAGPLVLGIAAAFTAAYAAQKLFGGGTDELTKDLRALADPALKIARVEEEITTATGLHRDALEKLLAKLKEAEADTARLARETERLTEKVYGAADAADTHRQALQWLNSGLNDEQIALRDTTLAAIAGMDAVQGLGQAMGTVDWRGSTREAETFAEKGLSKVAEKGKDLFDVLNDIKNASSDIFSRPTQEEAALQLRAAEIDRQIAALKVSGAGEVTVQGSAAHQDFDMINGRKVFKPLAEQQTVTMNPLLDALEEQREAIREQIDLMSADNRVQQLRLEVADRSLLTESEQAAATETMIPLIETQTDWIRQNTRGFQDLLPAMRNFIDFLNSLASAEPPALERGALAPDFIRQLSEAIYRNQQIAMRASGF